MVTDITTEKIKMTVDTEVEQFLTFGLAEEFYGHDHYLLWLKSVL